MSENHIAWDQDGEGLTMDELDGLFVQTEREEEDELLTAYGYRFHRIDVVKSMDPAAYRGLRGDWLSEMEEEGRLFDTQEACEQWRLDNGYEG